MFPSQVRPHVSLPYKAISQVVAVFIFPLAFLKADAMVTDLNKNKNFET
jgi:hypothetical protein